MSRTRAATDPFWATSLSRMDPGVAGIVRNLHAVVGRSPALAPYVWFGSGWRTGSVEHNSGRAIDIMIVEQVGRTPNAAELAAGNLLAKWLIRNGRALGIQWIVFSTDNKPRPQSYNMDRGSWNNLAPRGTVSGDHRDHLHVYFKRGASWPSSLNGAVVTGTAKPSPGLPGTGVNNIDPLPTAPADTRTDLERLLDSMDTKELRKLIREEVNATWFERISPDYKGDDPALMASRNNALFYTAARSNPSGQVQQVINAMRAEMAARPNATADEIAEAVAERFVDGVEVTVAAKG